MKIDLYISGVKADLSDDSFLLLNYTRDEAANPTVVKNSFSQTISLPATPTNDRIFSHFIRPDHQTASGFNPLVQTPFQIYNERDEIVESGYVKLQGTKTTANGTESYQIALYGGLGSLFYELTYKADGTKRTLADLKWHNGTSYVLPSTIATALTAANVKSAWTVLTNAIPATPTNKWQYVNFAPCNNGFPSCAFDADHAYYHYTPGLTPFVPNLYTYKDGYGIMTGHEGIIVEMSRDYTEWEMQDLRAYLQRPVLSVKGLLDALAAPANAGTYSLQLSPTLKASDYYLKGWLTLQMFDRDTKDPTTATLADLLAGTVTPAEYLIGIAKILGLCFIVDAATKTVTLETRNGFYDGTTVDLSDKVERENATTPNGIESKYYVFSLDAAGAFASDYKALFGKEYGAMWLNTGSEFEQEPVDTLDGCVFKGAADARESRPGLCLYGGEYTDNPYEEGERMYQSYAFKPAFIGTCSWKLYRVISGESASQEFTPTEWVIDRVDYNFQRNKYNDFESRPQFHDKDNKGTDGSNVLLFFNGMVTGLSDDILKWTIIFNVTDDTSDMLALNNGKPCWIIPNPLENFGTIPSFRRWQIYNPYPYTTPYVRKVWDFALPQQKATPANEIIDTNTKTVFQNAWEKYLADRYDADSVVVTRKVDLSGLVVSADLLRHFYYFDGCVWTLNRIINHAPTAHALTECEFIRVQDTTNYTAGQTL